MHKTSTLSFPNPPKTYHVHIFPLDYNFVLHSSLNPLIQENMETALLRSALWNQRTVKKNPKAPSRAQHSQDRKYDTRNDSKFSNSLIFPILFEPISDVGNRRFFGWRSLGSDVYAKLVRSYHDIGAGDFEIPARLCYKLCDTLVKHARSPSIRLPTDVFIYWPKVLRRFPHRRWSIPTTLDPAWTGDFGIQCEFNDQTLIKWAKAWSNLKISKRRLYHDNPVRDKDTPLAEALPQLCRNLKNLTLSFDASKLDLIPEILTMPRLGHGLKGGDDWDISVSQATPD